MTQHKVTFELVNPVAHPEYYCGHGEHPATDPATIPDEHWKSVESIGEAGSVLSQYTGLIHQVADGELIRNVRLWQAPDTVWSPVTLLGGPGLPEAPGAAPA